MKTVNVSDVRNWNPCYDPAIYRGEDWVGNALDILAIPEIPAKDKLWFVLREDMIDKTVLQEFANWCALRVRHLIKDDKWLSLDMGTIIEAMPEETQERSAISALHYAGHGRVFETSTAAAVALGDTERAKQISKLLELLSV